MQRRRRALREQLPVQLVDVVQQPLHARDARSTWRCPRRRAHAPRAGSRRQSRIAAASAAGSPGGTSRPRALAAEQVGRAADARRHHGTARGQRLDQRDRRALVARASSPPRRGRRRPRPCRGASRGSRRRRSARAAGLALPASRVPRRRPRRQKRTGGKRIMNQRGRPQEGPDVLDWDQASDHAHERRVVRKPRLPAAGCRAAAPPRERVELEAERDHADRSRRGHAQADQVLLTVSDTVQQRVGQPGRAAARGARKSAVLTRPK